MKLSLYDIIFSEEKAVKELSDCTLRVLGFIEDKRFRLALLENLLSDLIRNKRALTSIMRRCDGMPVKSGYLRKAFECVRDNILSKVG